MKLANLFVVISVLVVGTAWAAPAPLRVELLDSERRITETWDLVGAYSCKWDGMDLIVGFSDTKEPNALAVRVANAKPVLHNTTVTSATLDLEAANSNVVVTNQYKLQYEMTLPSKQYDWVGSKCSATVNLHRATSQIQFALTCDALGAKVNSGLLNLQARSAAFTCPK